MDSKKGNFLVVGIDNYSLVNSLKNAGYGTYVADYFGDYDIKGISDRFRSITIQRAYTSSGKFEEKYDPQKFIGMVEKLAEAQEFEGLLLSSGLDDSNQILYELNKICRITGNSPEQIKKTRDKELFFKELKELNIPHPETSIAKSLDSVLEVAEKIGYPVIIKPFEGFAGSGIRKVSNQKQLEDEYYKFSLNEENILVQEYINGSDISISFIAAYPDSKIISLNEQLIGLKKSYNPEPFGYCGNITPFPDYRSMIEKCKKIVDKITSHFKLLGSNGVDIVISKENIPYVIEVNPRFQGSLGCIEKAYSINLTKMHIEACTGKKLPAPMRNPSCFATRLILYAPKRLTAPDLTSNPNISDTPLPYTIIEKGEPVCSINTEGRTRQESLIKAQRISKTIIG